MPDMTIKEAAAFVQTHAHMSRAIIALAEAVGDGSKLEADLRDAERKLTEAQSAVDQAQRDLYAKQGEIEAAREVLKRLETETLAEGERAIQRRREILDKAEEDAGQIINDAKATADRIQTEAEIAAQGIIDKHKGLVSESETLDASIAVKKGELADLEERTERARAFLANLAEKSNG